MRPARCCARSSPSWIAPSARGPRGVGAHIAPQPPSPAGRFPYGVTTAPPNGAVHHRLAALDGLETGRGRRRPLHLDPAPSLTAVAVQRCAEAVAEAASCGVLVAIGGDLAVSGLAPAGGWRIALPTASDTVPTVLAIDGGALSTVGLPTRGPLRKLVVTATARPVEPVWRHLVVLGATAPAANAATSGALLRGAVAGSWLAGVRPRRPARRRPRRAPGGRLLARPHRHPRRSRLIPRDRPLAPSGRSVGGVPHDLPSTLGALRASGHVQRGVKDEIRHNLITALRAGRDPWPGIVGFEGTVLPQLERALLAGHDVVLLGERGQGKTRLLRALVGLLDEWTPVIAGAELGEHPYDPITPASRRRAAELGDDLPVAWRHRDERYTEKLATPDTAVADLIGDVDPVKVAEGRSLGDPETIHYGLVPARPPGHRGHQRAARPRRADPGRRCST